MIRASWLMLPALLTACGTTSPTAAPEATNLGDATVPRVADASALVRAFREDAEAATMDFGGSPTVDGDVIVARRDTLTLRTGDGPEKLVAQLSAPSPVRVGERVLLDCASIFASDQAVEVHDCRVRSRAPR